MSDDTPIGLGKRWDPDEALTALKSEATIMDVDLHDPVQVGEAVDQIFREHAPVVALGMVHTALHEPNPKVRTDAQKFVLERATTVADGGKDAMTQLLERFFAEPASVGPQQDDY